MIQYLEVEGNGGAATSILGQRFREYGKLLKDKPSLIVVTGGTSAAFWGEAVGQMLAELPLARICLTDFFFRSQALAEGRKDTNEQAVLEAFLAEAMAQQKILAHQLIFPNYTLGDPQTIANDLNQRLFDFRGKRRFDMIIASSGGGTYFERGPVDPGHVFGLPHGQPKLFEQEGPYVVANNMPKPPSTRITLNGSWDIGAMFTFCLGEKKTNALANIRAGLPPVECPASLTHKAEDGLVIYGQLSKQTA